MYIKFAHILTLLQVTEWCGDRESLVAEVLTELADGVLVLRPHKMVGEQLACKRSHDKSSTAMKFKKNHSY